jgi:hypothetical protein
VARAPENLGGQQSNPETIQHRKAILMEKLTHGWGRHRLIPWASEEWNITKRRAEQMIKEASKELADAYEMNRREWAAQLVAMAMETYVDAKKDRQHSAAIGAAALLAKWTNCDSQG